MLKGLAALFSSRVIFNPFVFFGVACGIYFAAKFDFEGIILEYKKYQLYALVLFVSILYNTFIKKHLKDGGLEVDWAGTFFATMGSFFRFFFASFLAISFMYFLFV